MKQNSYLQKTGRKTEPKMSVARAFIRQRVLFLISIICFTDHGRNVLLLAQNKLIIFFGYLLTLFVTISDQSYVCLLDFEMITADKGLLPQV